MPYIQQAWTQVMHGQTGSAIPPSGGNASRSTSTSAASAPPDGQSAQSSGRIQRTIPLDAANNGAPQHQPTDGEGLERDGQCASMASIQCMHNIVRSQIEALLTNKAAVPTDAEAFYQYTLSVETVLFCGRFSNMYLAHHNSFPEEHLIGRVFEPASKINPHRSMFLKILKHIGKRHPSLIATWDIFYDANDRVVIFQSYAIHGNLKEYIMQNNVYVPEQLMALWAKQIYSGMNFLGDAGICHRAINPKHILMTPAPDAEDSNRPLVKLSSFRDAVIYYDPSTGSIRNQPCRSVEKRKVANYQAPEVFGNVTTEEYSPVQADVWSFGATFFYISTRTYAFRYKADVFDIAADIQKTVYSAKTISDDAKRWFAGILHGNAASRTPFDKIAANAWFSSF